MDISRLLTSLNENKVRYLISRVSGEIQGVPVCFADLQGLIKMKEAAGRDKDLLDLKYLRELHKSKK